MKKKYYAVTWIICAMAGAVILSGCFAKDNMTKEQGAEKTEETDKTNATKETNKTEEINKRKEIKEESESKEPEILKTDWSDDFDGFNGAAVLYDASKQQFLVYNEKLAKTRRSPCSTFKIISSLTALEHGILEPDNSMRKWSGEIFWNENWNKDLDFQEAFQESCVWYYRELINDIGQELMQKELDRLAYGNCDISDWEGRLNTNNNNRALTGFWIESSLLISAMEQAEVMERIFGEHSVYSDTVRGELKDVMLAEDAEEEQIKIYGKTGMGKAAGITVDAWYTGFAETAGGNIYFCVYLGRTDDKNVTSAAAKDIAIRLLK